MGTCTNTDITGQTANRPQWHACSCRIQQGQQQWHRCQKQSQWQAGGMRDHSSSRAVPLGFTSLSADACLQDTQRLLWCHTAVNAQACSHICDTCLSYRADLFRMINELPTCYEVVSGKLAAMADELDTKAKKPGQGQKRQRPAVSDSGRGGVQS